MYNNTLEESGESLKLKAPSKKPRNLKQVYNRQRSITKVSPHTDHLNTLLMMQRDPQSLIRTVTVTDQSYVSFIYTRKQITDIEKFYCKESEAAVDTT